MTISFLLSGAILVLLFSHRANNHSVPELAGLWTVTKMNDVDPSVRYYMWENLNFKIDARGLMGNEDTPFTMMVSRGNCGPSCYYVYNSYSWYGEPLWRLERITPDHLFLHPQNPDPDLAGTKTEITVDRLKERSPVSDPSKAGY
jgi:hypothetical protein